MEPVLVAGRLDVDPETFDEHQLEHVVAVVPNATFTVVEVLAEA